jgi:nitrogen-specific signal transduction histidine kinase
MWICCLGWRYAQKRADSARRQSLYRGRRRIVAELAGPQVAEAIQLAIEYDPSPPFVGGHPNKASKAAVALMVRRNETAHKRLQQQLEKKKIAVRGRTGFRKRLTPSTRERLKRSVRAAASLAALARMFLIAT